MDKLLEGTGVFSEKMVNVPAQVSTVWYGDGTVSVRCRVTEAYEGMYTLSKEEVDALQNGDVGRVQEIGMALAMSRLLMKVAVDVRNLIDNEVVSHRKRLAAEEPAVEDEGIVDDLTLEDDDEDEDEEVDPNFDGDPEAPCDCDICLRYEKYVGTRNTGTITKKPVSRVWPW